MPSVYVGLDSKSYEKVSLYTHDGKAVREVLWGDYLTIDENRPADDKWVYIVWAPKTDKLLLKIKHLQQKMKL